MSSRRRVVRPTTTHRTHAPDAPPDHDPQHHARRARPLPDRTIHLLAAFGVPRRGNDEGQDFQPDAATLSGWKARATSFPPANPVRDGSHRSLLGFLLGPWPVRLGLAVLRLDDLVVAVDLEVLQRADDPRRPLDHDLLDPARSGRCPRAPAGRSCPGGCSPPCAAGRSSARRGVLQSVVDGDLELGTDGVAVAPGPLEDEPDPVVLRLGVVAEQGPRTVLVVDDDVDVAVVVDVAEGRAAADVLGVEVRPGVAGGQAEPSPLVPLARSTRRYGRAGGSPRTRPAGRAACGCC